MHQTNIISNSMNKVDLICLPNPGMLGDRQLARFFYWYKISPLENKLHAKQGACLFLLTGLPLSLTGLERLEVSPQ